METVKEDTSISKVNSYSKKQIPGGDQILNNTAEDEKESTHDVVAFIRKQKQILINLKRTQLVNSGRI